MTLPKQPYPNPNLLIFVAVGLCLVIITIIGGWLPSLGFFTTSRTNTVLGMGGTAMVLIGIYWLYRGKTYGLLINIATALAVSLLVWFVLLQKILLSTLHTWALVIALVITVVIVTVLQGHWQDELKPLPINRSFVYKSLCLMAGFGTAFYLATYVIPTGQITRLILTAIWFCLVPGALFILLYADIIKAKTVTAFMVTLWLTVSLIVPAITLYLLNQFGISLNTTVVRLLPLAMSTPIAGFMIYRFRNQTN